MEYKGYKIQVNQFDVVVIDSYGNWLIKVATVQEATEWIDEHTEPRR